MKLPSRVAASGSVAGVISATGPGAAMPSSDSTHDSVGVQREKKSSIWTTSPPGSPSISRSSSIRLTVASISSRLPSASTIR